VKNQLSLFHQFSVNGSKKATRHGQDRCIKLYQACKCDSCIISHEKKQRELSSYSHTCHTIETGHSPSYDMHLAQSRINKT